MSKKFVDYAENWQKVCAGPFQNSNLLTQRQISRKLKWFWKPKKNPKRWGCTQEWILWCLFSDKTYSKILSGPANSWVTPDQSQKIQARNWNFEQFSALRWSLRCLRFGILHLLLTELSFDTPGVEIGAFLKKIF